MHNLSASLSNTFKNSQFRDKQVHYLWDFEERRFKIHIKYGEQCQNIFQLQPIQDVRNSALCTKIHIFPQRGKSKVQNTESSEEQSDKMLEFV